MPYCPKCGKEVKDDDVHCPNCGALLKSEGGVTYRRHGEWRRGEKNERNEKNEKDEKNEKNERDRLGGSIVGGLVLLWLGTSFLLQEYGYISSRNWWSWFLVGIGAILVLRGLYEFTHTGMHKSTGFLIGGMVAAAIGLAGIMNFSNGWSIVLIIAGAAVILSGVSQRNKNPAP